MLRSLFNIYPNPTKAYFAVKGAQLSNIASIQVFDMIGKKVAYFTNVATNHFDISNLVTGVYLVQIKGADNQTEILRLVKE